MTDRRYRLAYLVTHPIQYQAPLLRLISGQPDIELTVFFQSDMSLRAYSDRGFGQMVEWDVPLIDGYQSEFLPGLWRHGPITAQRPINWGFASRLRRSRFDVLWVHGYARAINWAAMLCAKASGLKVFVRDEATQDSAARTNFRRRAKRVFFAGLAGIVDAFLAIGTSNRQYYLAHSIAPERIFLMPYSVDIEFFAKRAHEASASRERLRQELGLDAGRPIILFASKFEARKRPLDLLEAFERLRGHGGRAGQAYLLLTGDGELRAPLEAKVRASGLHDARFLGFRNQTELPGLYDLSDVMVLPSNHEPWGLVVNEFMATGKPVVVSDAVGCAPDLVHSGVNGFVFPVGNVKALAEALSCVLQDPHRAARMGVASREIISTWSFREDVAGLRQALRATLEPTVRA
jgi:glycosyltransferase involved in cell wall biosynthesis